LKTVVQPDTTWKNTRMMFAVKFDESLADEFPELFTYFRVAVYFFDL